MLLYLSAKQVLYFGDIEHENMCNETGGNTVTMKKSNSVLMFATVAALTLFAAQSAQATTVYDEVAWTVTTAKTGNEFGLSVGNIITGKIYYDNAFLVDPNPANQGSGYSLSYGSNYAGGQFNYAIQVGTKLINFGEDDSYHSAWITQNGDGPMQMSSFSMWPAFNVNGSVTQVLYDTYAWEYEMPTSETFLGVHMQNTIDYDVYTGAASWVSRGAAPGAPVPLPGAVWLFGSGLVGLVGIRRKFTA